MSGGPVISIRLKFRYSSFFYQLTPTDVANSAHAFTQEL